MLARVARDTALVCGVLTFAAALWRPGDWRLPLGVAGGGALMGLAFWAIRGGVDGWMRGGAAAARRGPGLVKFFTRHAMLALAAYGMMVRLHLDPVGMLTGVCSLSIAVVVEAARRQRSPKAARRGP